MAAQTHEGAVTQQQAKAHLIVFIHPRCPGSRATISELARIMAVAQGRLDVDVFIPAPRSATHDWVRSELWRDASAIPCVRG